MSDPMPIGQDSYDRRTPDDTFGSRLVLIRHEIGQREQGRMLSVEEIAERCDIKPSTWSTWERGAKPRDKAEVVDKIAQATGYDHLWLIWGDNFHYGESVNDDEPTWSVLSNPIQPLPLEWPRPPHPKGRHLSAI